MCRCLISSYLAYLALASITVYSPEDLRTEVLSRHRTGALSSSLASFGSPPIGRSMIGRVYFAAPEPSRPCGDLVPILFHEDALSGSSPIVLLDRSHCTYLNQVKRAQSIGAKAVLVISDTDENVESANLPGGPQTKDVVIPSFLVSRSDGNLLKKFLDEGREVVLVLSFSKPGKNNHVEYTIWMSSGEAEIMTFLSKFARIADEFRPAEVSVVPHFVLWHCSQCKETGYQQSQPNCLSGGRYCSPDPDGNGPLQGRDVVLEDLRELCLLNTTSKSHWFDYISKLGDTKRGITEANSYTAMSHWDGVESAVRKCVENSKEGTDITVDDNSLLRAEKRAWNEHGPAYYPSIKINNETYKGGWDPEELKSAICAKFSDPPETCWDVKIPSPETKSIGAFTIILVLLVVLLLLIAALFICRLLLKREMRKELKQQVNVAVSQYISLSDQSGSPRDPIN